ncbi:hypothetical protein [Hydrogenophaga sp.]|uniref:hypothetical protein n=1 Tax=Hydrogenophaga sp. TaxID=1904254 RepID=UPI003D105B77
MLETFIDFMTTLHMNGRRGGVYGWVLILGATCVLFGIHAPRQQKAQKLRKINRYSPLVASRSITASVVIDSADRSCRVDGEIRNVEGCFQLTLFETVNGAQTELPHCFETLENLEAFLEAETILRLRDFK